MGEQGRYRSNRHRAQEVSTSTMGDGRYEESDYSKRYSEGETEEDYGMKYKEKYANERGAISDAQSVAYTAYNMNLESGQSIVNDLRNVGVTVLSLESLSTEAMIHYMDAVTTMRLGDENDEKCMLYTDRMGRVFNVIISGGAEGLAKTWSSLQAEYSGLFATIVIPFVVRMIASYSSTAYQNAEIETTALHPLMMLLIFGLLLQNEISHSRLTMSIMVRGSNSVGSHVWRGGSLTDYPRIIVLTILLLASFASLDDPVRDILTLVGSIFGGVLIFCNLGSRAWKKLEIGFIDSTNVFSSIIVFFAALSAGIVFPFVGLRSVHGGTDVQDAATDVEKIISNPNGKRARQNITGAATFVAFVFLFSDATAFQKSLGFDFTKNRAYVNLVIGVWWFLSTLASMALCHRLDSSQNKKIEPFLRREETSPVGWIMPSVPNIVIDPNLARGRMILSRLSYGSDIICALLLTAIALLIIYMGLREIQGNAVKSFWNLS